MIVCHRPCLPCKFWLHIRWFQCSSFNHILWLALSDCVERFCSSRFARMIIPLYFVYRGTVMLAGMGVRHISPRERRVGCH